MSVLYLDVETVPLAASLAAPYPADDRPAPSNYKDVAKIAEWHARDREKWAAERAKECALTPRLGRIVCLGWAMDDQESKTLCAVTEADELMLLVEAWNMIRHARQIVTFNGGFDLRFIAVRSMIRGLTPPPHIDVAAWFRRYSTYPHFDCRAVLTGWDDRQTGKLHEWAASFGIPADDTTTGADIYGFVQAGEWDKVRDHCHSDVALTRELYRRIAPVFGGMAA